jgi:DNA-directed RNA polymerase specialized sigma24 family protein
MASWQQTLAELARDQAGSLKRQAFLLCGDDSQAEDLVQDALVRAFARPLRAPRPGAAEAYVRVIMVNLFIDIAAARRAAPPVGQRSARRLAGRSTTWRPRAPRRGACSGWPGCRQVRGGRCASPLALAWRCRRMR